MTVDRKLTEMSRSVTKYVIVPIPRRSTTVVKLWFRVVVEEGTFVRKGTTIEGPVVLMPGTEIGPNAHPRGAAAVDTEVRMGHGVEVKNLILFTGATVPHLSYLGNSILGRDVNLGAGTKVANLWYDNNSVTR